MKTKIGFVILLISAFGQILPISSFAQSWGGNRRPGFWDDWSVNANAGLTSFFGDLSKFDSEIMEKLSQESGPAMSAILTKYFIRRIGISGQLLYGNLKGENNSMDSFEATIIEFNVHARFHFINIISPNNISKFGIEAYGGVGQFLFKTTRYDNRNNEMEIHLQNTGTPEFLYFFGLGLSYKVSDKIGITGDIAMRQAQNDKLDDFVKNNNYDYYTYVNIGLTYHLKSMTKSPASVYKSRSMTGGRPPGHLPMRRRR